MNPSEQALVEIGSLRANFETLARQLESHRAESISEHRKVHDIVVATNEAIRNLAREVAEMKPLTEDYREKRAEARGAARLAGWLYTAAGVIGGFVVFAASKIAEWLSVRPHP